MGMREIAELDGTGDTKYIWDSDNDADVEMAREHFKKLVDKGFAIFHVKDDGKPGKKMHEFSRDAEKMIAVPRVVGG